MKWTIGYRVFYYMKQLSIQGNRISLLVTLLRFKLSKCRNVLYLSRKITQWVNKNNLNK
jgi:hypothetical protein